MFQRITGIALLFTASIALHAANIITTTGTTPFGFTGQPAFVMAWNQTTGYTGVTITMPLVDNTPTPLTGVQGTVYLTNQIGPGTTSANNVAAPFSISGLTGSVSTVTVFSGLTLPPGNYYLVLVPTNTNPMSSSPQGASSVNVTLTTGTSVTSLAAGTLAPSLTPAPTSLLLMLTGLAAAAALWFARRKFAAQA